VLSTGGISAVGRCGTRLSNDCQGLKPLRLSHFVAQGGLQGIVLYCVIPCFVFFGWGLKAIFLYPWTEVFLLKSGLLESRDGEYPRCMAVLHEIIQDLNFSNQDSSGSGHLFPITLMQILILIPDSPIKITRSHGSQNQECVTVASSPAPSTFGPAAYLFDSQFLLTFAFLSFSLSSTLLAYLPILSGILLNALHW